MGSSAYIINRLPEIWGEDANEFRPERWLETDSEKLSQMSEFLRKVAREGCVDESLLITLCTHRELLLHIWGRLENLYWQKYALAMNKSGVFS